MKKWNKTTLRWTDGGVARPTDIFPQRERFVSYNYRRLIVHSTQLNGRGKAELTLKYPTSGHDAEALCEFYEHDIPKVGERAQILVSQGLIDSYDLTYDGWYIRVAIDFRWTDSTHFCDVAVKLARDIFKAFGITDRGRNPVFGEILSSFNVIQETFVMDGQTKTWQSFGHFLRRKHGLPTTYRQ